MNRKKVLTYWGWAILCLFLFVGLQEQVRVVIDNVLLPIFSITQHWALDVVVLVLFIVFVFHYVKIIRNKKLGTDAESAILFFLIICYGFYRWDELVYFFTRFSLSSHIAYTDVIAILGVLYIFYWIISVIGRIKEGTVAENISDCLLPSQDVPLKKIDDDKFAMRGHVRRVVSYLSMVDVSEKAFSIGVVGNWGYGKSSFFNFIKDEIKEKKEFIVMDFNPRSSKDIHCIQEDFLNGLREVLKPFHSNLTEIFEDYAQSLNISTNTSPIISFLFRLFKLHSKSWTESYNNINNLIKQLKRRIVIFVDDLDRLTAKELLEVLKVIDKNGAFCNVVFVSAYDKDYVNNALKAYLRHDVKCPYTDKYFDLEIKLPKHAFHLLMDYLLELMKKAGEGKQISLSHEKVREKILGIEDYLRKRLHTVRDVKRFTNQFLYSYPTVQTEVDFEDYILLELMRFSHKEEYDKLRDFEYVNVYAKTNSDIKVCYLSHFLYQNEDRVGVCCIDILEKLFPTGEADNFDSNPGRICNANSFDIYFYNNEYDHIFQKDFDSLYKMSLEECCNKIDLWLDNEKPNSPHEADIINYMTSQHIASLGDTDRLKTYFQLLVYLQTKSDASGIWLELKKFFQKDDANMNISHYDFGDKTAYLDWIKDVLVELFAIKSDVSIYIFPKIIDEMQKNKLFNESLIYESHEFYRAATLFLEEYLKKIESSNWDAKIALRLSAINVDDEGHFYKPMMKCLRKAIENYPDKFQPLFMPIIINDNSGNTDLKFLSYDSDLHLRELFPNPGDFQNIIESQEADSYEDIDIIRKFYRIFMRNSFHRVAIDTPLNSCEEIISAAYSKVLVLENLSSEVNSFRSGWGKVKKLKDIEICLRGYNSYKQSINKVDLDIRYKEIILRRIDIFISKLMEYKERIGEFSKEMVVGDFVRLKEERLNNYSSQRLSKSDVNLCKIKEILPDDQLRLDSYRGMIPTSAVEAVPVDGIADKKVYYDPVVAASTVMVGASMPVYITDRSYYMEHFKKCYNNEGKSFYDIVVENNFEFVHEVQHWLRREFHEDLKSDVLIVFRGRNMRTR